MYAGTPLNIVASWGSTRHHAACSTFGLTIVRPSRYPTHPDPLVQAQAPFIPTQCGGAVPPCPGTPGVPGIQINVPAIYLNVLPPNITPSSRAGTNLHFRGGGGGHPCHGKTPPPHKRVPPPH